MIRNIIFDMGNVLLRFDREIFMNRHAADCTPEERTLLLREVFLSAEWIMQDRGTHTPSETVEIICERLPGKLHKAVEGLVNWYIGDIMPVDGMAELIEELKQEGYKIYLLSNAAKDFPNYWNRIPGHEYFDVSAFHGFIKPQPEIYTCALEKFGVLAEECVFIDDVPANIEAAMNIGMKGIVFHDDVKELRRKLAQMDIKLPQ